MREPWICPKCGRTLTIRNQEHSCAQYGLEDHLVGKDPIGRAAFEWICDILDPLGPYDILPMKTMIGFAKRVNVGFIKTRVWKFLSSSEGPLIAQGSERRFPIRVIRRSFEC
jgi:hypothetical protein